MKERIYISVINDLVTDQRVHRIATTLRDSGYPVTMIGRKMRTSPSCEIKGIHVKRFRLIFNQGFLFYASFNIRLFLYLLFRPNLFLLISNDLDTLPANALISRIRGVKLVYDSHEYFTEVPELQGREFVKRFWEKLERMTVPKVHAAYTVNESLAKMYSVKYGIEFGVIRNVPDGFIEGRKFSLPDAILKKRFIIYQGAVNRDRGLEELVEIMGWKQELNLVIAGDGDVLKSLKEKVKKLGLDKNVHFTGKLRPAELKWLTTRAVLGISLEKKTNLNYYYALPNKIFDYIHAGIPVLCSDFPEMRKIIEKYGVGKVVNPGDKEEILERINFMLNDKDARDSWRSKSISAARDLNWKNEQKKLVNIYKKVGVEIKHNP